MSLILPATAYSEHLENNIYLYEHVTRESQVIIDGSTKSISFGVHFYIDAREQLVQFQAITHTTIGSIGNPGEPGATELTIYSDSGKTNAIGSGTANYLINYYSNGTIKNHIYWFDIDEWDLDDLSGQGMCSSIGIPPNSTYLGIPPRTP